MTLSKHIREVELSKASVTKPAVDPAIERFLAAGGKISRVPRGRRALNDRHADLLERHEFAALANYERERQEIARDVAARRAQRGTPKCQTMKRGSGAPDAGRRG